MSNHQTTSETPADVTVFDHTNPEFIQDPYPAYAMLRQQAPVFFYPAGMGWIISSYRDVSALLRDHRLSTSINHWEHASAPKSEQEMCDFDRLLNSSLMQLEKKDHQRIRALTLPAFSPKILQKTRPAIELLVNETFDALGDCRQFNFAEAVAHPVSIKTISRLLGVPRQDEVLFRCMAEAVMIGMNPLFTDKERAEATAGVTDGLAMLQDLIEFRRQNPDGMFLSTLIAAGEDRDRLSVWEMQALVGVLLAVGMVTASNSMNKLVWCLLEHPTQLDEVLIDPAMFQPALSETLRHRFFGSLGFRRFALEDLEVAGRQIKKGQMLYLNMGSALRDPEIFADADRFDITRDQSNNIAFGLGAHYCIGVSLPTMQAEVVFNTLMKRYPQISLDRPLSFNIATLNNIISELWLNTYPN